MKKNNKKFKSGVTLIETIISLGILTVGIISTLSLMMSAVSYSRDSEQMVVVVNLAREGIEIARNLRSQNGFDYLTGGSKIFGIDYLNDYLEMGNADNSSIAECINCDLKIWNNRYFHNLPSETGEETIYKRMIKIEEPMPNEEKKLISTVYWTERGREHTFKLEAHLTDWE
jgi:type II secretory pathway pseudopilin PulG